MKRQLAVHQSFQYAQNVVNGTIPSPKYVIKQCEKFLEICDGKSEKYFLDEQKLQHINDILKLLIMPRGLKAGSSIYECSCGYQWLLYAAALCVVYRENPDRRRYETVILEVGRKNFKTFTIATIFVLLFLLEPKYSKFYSVAPDGALSREVKTAIEETFYSDKKEKGRYLWVIMYINIYIQNMVIYIVEELAILIREYMTIIIAKMIIYQENIRDYWKNQLLCMLNYRIKHKK